MNGKPAVTLEIKKRIGSNIIETLDDVKELIEQVKPYWPEGIEVGIAQDESESIKELLHDLFKDRKSTRLNSSHVRISYAVFCLKKKKIQITKQHRLRRS